MRRGDVYDVDLDPIAGSEQAGKRPVVVVSRDSINNASRVAIGVPCTSFRPGRRIYASQVLLLAPDGGLAVDSVALCEQVRALDQGRFHQFRGELSSRALALIDRALLIALDLDRSIDS